MSHEIIGIPIMVYYNSPHNWVYNPHINHQQPVFPFIAQMILFTKNQLFVPRDLGKILIETVRHTQNEISHSLQELEYDKYCESLIFLRLLCKSLIIFYLQTTLALKILSKIGTCFFSRFQINNLSKRSRNPGPEFRPQWLKPWNLPKTS